MLTSVDSRLLDVWRSIGRSFVLWPENGPEERQRLSQALLADNFVEPRFAYAVPPIPNLRIALRSLRQDALELPHPWDKLYGERIDELELEYALLCVMPSPKAVAPLARRRYGCATDPLPHGRQTLHAFARTSLQTLGLPSAEPRVSGARFREALEKRLRDLQIDFPVRVYGNMSADVAVTQTEVLLRGNGVFESEMQALVRHEIDGHAYAQARANEQSLALLQVGTARAFAHQEGVALTFETMQSPLHEDAFARLKRLPLRRARMLCARVIAAEMAASGTPFFTSARVLIHDYGFDVYDAVKLAERAYRRGGLGRELSYLVGYLEVQHALVLGLPLGTMRIGKVGLEAAKVVTGLL